MSGLEWLFITGATIATMALLAWLALQIGTVADYLLSRLHAALA